MMYSTTTQPYKYSFLLHTLKGLYCTFCLIVGIIYAFTQQSICLYALALSVALSYLFELSKSTILCGILFFAAGYARLCHLEQQHAHLLEHIAHYTNIKGTITAAEKASCKQYRSMILINITDYYKDNLWVPCKQSWQLQCYTKQLFNGTVDDIITIQNFKYKAPSAKNSFLHFLMKEGIHATTFIDKNSYKVIEHPKYSLQRTIHDIKYRLLEAITKKCSRLTTTLFVSVFLGNRLYVKEQYQQIKQLFAHWGILHFLARSGIHMIIFIFFLYRMLQLLPLNFRLKQIILLTLGAIYMLLSWQSVSFSRALFTFAWYKTCQLYALQTNTLHIILALSCIFLLYNPLLLFFLDFQLSFGITLVLAITNQYLFT